MKISRLAIGLPLFVSVLTLSTASFANEINRSLKGDRLDRTERAQVVQIPEKAEKALPVIQPQKPVVSQILFDYQRQSPPQSQTQAVAALDDCPDCQVKTAELKKAQEIQKIIEIANPPRVNQGPNMCVTRSVVASMKAVHRSKYRGRFRGRGDCGRAVRQALNHAGIWSGGGIGHAKDMIPGLRKMGFKNLMKPGMTPASAPNGAILVYGAAPKNLRKFCRGQGTWFGHIEVKENNNSFIYDGNPTKSIQAYYGASCRPLIGVMMMGDSCPTCKPAIKRSCDI